MSARMSDMRIKMSDGHDYNESCVRWQQAEIPREPNFSFVPVMKQKWTPIHCAAVCMDPDSS